MSEEFLYSKSGVHYRTSFLHSLFYQTKALPSTKKPVYMSLTERYLSFTYLASLRH